MNIFERTLFHFQEISRVPRPSYEEKQIRSWLIQWAEGHRWYWREDASGNLLIRATSSDSAENETLCLQAHMDMVCVSEQPHDWSRMGVTVIEEHGILRGDGTTLGADNGIGMAVMMALAERDNRPHLELLFTMGEEVGLIGAHHFDLPITARYGINLDWCDSESVGVGCGGTLLIDCTLSALSIPQQVKSNVYILSLAGMRGGHSGADIHKNHGNALIELCRIITESDDIIGVGDLQGGYADNAIPRHARATVHVKNDANFYLWLAEKERDLRQLTNTPGIVLTYEPAAARAIMYDKHILQICAELGSGVQTWSDDRLTPLSSWNLGKMQYIGGRLTWCYFLRSNIPGGVGPMKNTILTTYQHLSSFRYTLGHEGAVWHVDVETPFIQRILSHVTYDDNPLPAVTTHATVETGALSVRFPNMQWVSLGATCHDMHTTREYIFLRDLEEFCERLEAIVTR